jgi:outer membrane protein OmpA-like peptidoglycan-associated protein
MKKTMIAFMLACVFHISSKSQQSHSCMVYFDDNSHTLTPGSNASIDSLIIIAGKEQVKEVYLKGHCDSRGSHAYNEVLSLKRVKSVQEYVELALGNKGVIFHPSSHGETQLLNKDRTAAERALNRRVELILQTDIPPAKSDPKAIAVIPVSPVADSPMIFQQDKRTLTEILSDTLSKQGSVVSLPNLQFVGGTAKFLPGSIPILKELLLFLQDNPRFRIAIEGHICCNPQRVESEYLEQSYKESKYMSGYYKLSELRARTVWLYLTENGIAENRLTYKGFGSSRPIYPLPEKSEYERMINRRVEIRILQK